MAAQTSAGQRASEFFPPPFQDVVREETQKAVEMGGEFAGGMTTPLNLGAMAAGGIAGGVAKGVGAQVLKGAFVGSAVPAMVESMQTRDPRGTVLAGLSLAPFVKSPRVPASMAGRFTRVESGQIAPWEVSAGDPTVFYKSASQFLNNNFPPFATRQVLRNAINQSEGQLSRDAKVLSQAMNLPEGHPLHDLLWGTRLYVHGGSGFDAMQEASRIYITTGRPPEFKDLRRASVGNVELFGIEEGVSKQARYDDAHLLAPRLVDTIRAAQPENVRLFRGYGAVGQNELNAQLKGATPGDIIVLDRLSSFTTSQTIGRQFQVEAGPGRPAKRVILETVGPVKRLNVAPLSQYEEAESLSFGKFRVEKVELERGHPSRFGWEPKDAPTLKGKHKTEEMGSSIPGLRITMRQVEP
jgi:hypothetical protein